MKVLLTGASGFVGSHVLDALRAHGLDTAILLRPSSGKSLIASHLSAVDVRTGSIDDPQSLRQALTGITHVIHCAGATKARRNSEFYEINQIGTRNVVAAANTQKISRLIHISSLAAAGPATGEKPAREADPPRPVSEYGRSKLAGENEVRAGAAGEFVILRPPAVYGPRDAEFLRLFKAIKRHVLPKTAQQPLSFVFVHDLAQAVLQCLGHSKVVGNTYFVAARETADANVMAKEIAWQTGTWTVPLPMPAALFWPICLAQEIMTRLTGKTSVLSLQKYAELRAPGWVCDPSRLENDTGFRCVTTLKTGIAQTYSWYRENHWL